MYDAFYDNTISKQTSFKDKNKSKLGVYVPVIDYENNNIGIISIMMTKEDLNTNISKSILQILGFIIILNILIIVVMHRITRKNILPIQGLRDYVESMENGFLNVSFGYKGKDEIGQLAQKFQSLRQKLKDQALDMDNTIEKRTKELSEEKQNIAALLNNMKQAIFKINSEYKILSPISGFSYEIFGPRLEGKNIFNVVFKDLEDNSETKANLTSALEAVFNDSEIQWMLSESYFPKKVPFKTANSTKILKISYIPLWNFEGYLDEIMINIEDITQLEKMAEDVSQREELIAIIQEISLIKIEELKDFLQGTNTLLNSTFEVLRAMEYSDETYEHVFRALHTLKGNSRFLGLTQLSQLTHKKENIVAQIMEKRQQNQPIEDSMIETMTFGIYEIRNKLQKYSSMITKLYKIQDEHEIKLVNTVHQQIIDVDIKLSNLVSKEEGLDPNNPESVAKAILSNEDSKALGEIKSILDSCLSNLRTIGEQFLSVSLFTAQQGFINGVLTSRMYQKVLHEFLVPWSQFKDGFFSQYLLESKVQYLTPHINDLMPVIGVINKLKALKEEKPENAGNQLKLYSAQLNSFAQNLEDKLCLFHLTQKVHHEIEETSTLDGFSLQGFKHYIVLHWMLSFKHETDTKAAHRFLDLLDKRDEEELNTFLKNIPTGKCMAIALLKEMQFIGENALGYFDWLFSELSALFNPIQTTKSFINCNLQSLIPLMSEIRYHHHPGHFTIVNNSSHLHMMLNAVISQFPKTSSHLYKSTIIQMLEEYSEIDYSKAEAEHTKVYQSNIRQLKDRLVEAKPELSSDNFHKLSESIEQLTYLELKNSCFKFKKMVDDLSSKLKKFIDFSVYGEDVFLDRERLQLLQDALVHIVRNCVDHGIEDPEERKTLGKPEKGNISIECSNKDNFIYLTIKDDGQGLNTQGIIEKAIATQTIEAGQEKSMSEEEIFELIFQPNFSTKKKANQISGRGVGMNVVKKNVNEIYGTIKVRSQENLGTTFEIVIEK